MTHPAFLPPSLPSAAPVKRRQQAWRCAASSDRPSTARVSRRALLAAFALLPFRSEAKENSVTRPTDEKPQTGFLTKSGVKYFDFAAGEGPTPRWGELLNIDYVVYTISPSGDGLVRQDSSLDYNSEGYLIHHGNGEIVLGLEEALHTMAVGGRRRVIIPEKMAYWKAGFAPVPLPDSKRRKFLKALNESDGTVVFDVELRRIWKDVNDTGYYDDLVLTDEELLQLFDNVREEKAKNGQA